MLDVSEWVAFTTDESLGVIVCVMLNVVQTAPLLSDRCVVAVQALSEGTEWDVPLLQILLTGSTL